MEEWQTPIDPHHYYELSNLYFNQYGQKVCYATPFLSPSQSLEIILFSSLTTILSFSVAKPLIMRIIIKLTTGEQDPPSLWFSYEYLEFSSALFMTVAVQLLFSYFAYNKAS